jgi:hypothetical protein
LAGNLTTPERPFEAVKKEGLRRWGRFAWLAFFYAAQGLENPSKRLGYSSECSRTPSSLPI